MTGDHATGDALGRLFGAFERGREHPRGGREGTQVTALLVPCTAARNDHAASLWPVEPAWRVARVPTLGNVAWERQAGDRTLAGALAGAAGRELGAVVVVGHTECGAVADAYERYRGRGPDAPAGIEARLAPLVAVVGEAVDAGVVDASTPPRTAQYRLVEYNVVRQVAFLAGALPPTATVAGYVHDEDGAYSSFPGEHYLVAADGETDADALRARLPEDRQARVASLLP
jgi:carbonic anhydrase